MHNFKTVLSVFLFVAVAAYKGRTAESSFPCFAGETSFGNGAIEFYVCIDSAIFLLTGVQDKYRVIEIRVVNQSEKLLRLSDQKDAITVVFNKTQITGVIDVYRDATFWDALAPETRKLLAYPENVPKNEEETVFVFIPKSSSEELPSELRYRIASLPGEIVIARRK